MAQHSVQAPHSLAPLPYAYDALEPYIDARTVEIHYTKHHASYVAKLNQALEGYPELAATPLETLLAGLNAVPAPIRAVVRDHGGGHAAHTLYWRIMSKEGGRAKGRLAGAIESRFGSVDGLLDALDKAAMGQFGSGWAWLSLDTGKQLVVEATPNHDSPLTAGRTPLMVLDVWEHAYYLKYQNRRAEYVAAFHNLINWDYISGEYDRLISGNR